MKRQRFRSKLIALFLIGLFALLGFYGIYSVHTYGSRWFSYAANPRLSAQKNLVVKGDVLDRNGVLLASSDQSGNRVFNASSDVRKALVHVLGDRNNMVANGVESFHAGYLYGYSSSLFDAIRHLTRPDEERKGNQLTLTVDSDLCTSIPEYFEAHPVSKGKSGAAVVMNYHSGEILAMISLPSFDPDHYTEELITSVDHPFWNRATQGLYPPGSTFKIVTSAAAFEKIPDLETRSFSCSGSLSVSDNFSVQDYQNAVHGTLSLNQAFLRSCNVVYAGLALEIGNVSLRSAAERFGFNQNFLFRDLVVYNSSYPSSDQAKEGLAASGYGQSSLTATPLHLCLLSGAIANGGTAVEPHLLKKVTASSGNTVLSLQSGSAFTACSNSIAAKISLMMKDVVQGGGSGSPAVVTTLDIRGKTGTSVSTSDGSKISYGWFTGFNAQKDLPIAVCVLVEDIPDGETGGTVAAPIARDIFSWLKNHPNAVMP